MKKRSQSEDVESALRDRIIGLGERSLRKSYYPQLQQKIEDLERIRKQLLESEARYRSLVENIKEVIISMDAEGKVAYVSPSIKDLSGFSPEFVVSKLLDSFAASPDRRGLQASLKSAMAGRLDAYEFRLLTKNGAVRNVLLSFRPLVENGQVSGLTGVMSDVTERKQAENAVLKLNAELEERVADRTAALEAANRELEAFSYSVSHDLRAPLRTIAGFSRILQEDYSGALDSEGRRCLALVGEGVDRMERLIDDLLAFSRMSRSDMDMRIIDVGALADDVFAELRAAVPGRNIRFARNNLPPARCDLAMLRQALTNLLSNAIKYTSRRPEALIEVSAKAGESENVYCVKDNGAGFDMRHVDKLFCAFQRLHSSSEFEGTGVGLAIVKRIVERHGGRVWAEGKVNGGAAIYFALPRGPAVTASA